MHDKYFSNCSGDLKFVKFVTNSTHQVEAIFCEISTFSLPECAKHYEKYLREGETAVAQLLRCCAKIGRSLVRSQLVSVDFSLTKNPSDRTMALGSTQPLTEMSTRSISWR